MIISAKSIETGRNFINSQLDEFMCRLNISTITSNPTYDGGLYHYTAVKNINSILIDNHEKTVLWASRYDCLNDASEGQIITNVYNKTCKKLKNENKISEELFEVIYTVKPNRTSLFIDVENNRFVRCEVDTYITSFSKEYDLLAMWNYYSKGNIYDGINLGFDSEAVKRSLINNTPLSGVDIQICPVIYDEEQQMKLIEGLIISLKDKYMGNKDDPYLRYVIAYKLTEWKMLFKSKHFEHEKEVRIITRVGKKFTDEICVKYRESFGYIIPYIELEIDKDSLIQTTFAPMPGDENRKISQYSVMKEILKSTGYNADIKFSEIPVRY